MSLPKKVTKIILAVVLAFILVMPIRGTTVDSSLELEQVRSFSRVYEFDYISWSASALLNKITQSRLGVERLISAERGREIVLDYLELRNQVVFLEHKLEKTLSDPQLEDKELAAAPIREELSWKRARKQNLAPYVEQLVQSQMDIALTTLDLSLGGQLIPPVLYRAESNSYALIVSPRDEIHQLANLMLVPDLTIDQMIKLEGQIEQELNLSALVVGIGGVGLYPSMVIEAGGLDWLLHVVGHEWTHNYLTIRPLGANYFSSPELRTINETIADLSGDAIRERVYQLYYPEYLPETVDIAQESEVEEELRVSFQARKDALLESQNFDFRREMHTTRLVVDRLLAEGKISEAERYLESRRQFFWQNGYQIRKLNQAYFAFHGSYAAAPGGAAGSSGVDLGQMLRRLRDQVPTYAEFMRSVAWRWRLDQFQELFQSQGSG